MNIGFQSLYPRTIINLIGYFKKENKEDIGQQRAAPGCEKRYGLTGKLFGVAGLTAAVSGIVINKLAIVQNG